MLFLTHLQTSGQHNPLEEEREEAEGMVVA